MWAGWPAANGDLIPRSESPHRSRCMPDPRLPCRQLSLIYSQSHLYSIHPLDLLLFLFICDVNTIHDAQDVFISLCQVGGNAQPSTPNSQLPTLNAQLPTLNSQLPTLNSQLPTLNAQLPTLNAQRSTPNAQRSTPNAQRSTLNAQRPTPNAQRSTLNAQRPTLNARNAQG